jgi:hypothetical protein
MHCGNKATHFEEDSIIGYCDECYTPCIGCGEAKGEEYYDGYCHECYYAKYCANECGNEATHFEEDSIYGFCDECYSEQAEEDASI